MVKGNKRTGKPGGGKGRSNGKKDQQGGTVSPTPKKGKPSASIDAELLEKCDYDYNRYMAAKAAIAEGEKPTEPDEEDSNRDIKDNGTANPEGNSTTDHERKDYTAEATPADSDGRGPIKNMFGQVWDDTVEPPTAVKIALANISRKLEKGEMITGEDVTISTNSAVDRVAGISLTIAAALLLAFFRHRDRGEELDAAHVSQYLQWFSRNKLLKMINEPEYSDKLISTILAHEGSPTKFDPSQIQVSLLRSLHGQELSKKLDSENPTEQEMETALRNAIGRCFPRDANELIDQMKREANWKKGGMVYEKGGLMKWIDGLKCPKVEVIPPIQYDLSLLDSITGDEQGRKEDDIEDETEGETQGKGDVFPQRGKSSDPRLQPDEDEAEAEDDENDEVQDVPDLELNRSFNELQPMADMKIDEADFPFKPTDEARDILLRSLPAYILEVAPKYLHAARKLKDLTTDRLVTLLQPIEFVKFLNKHGVEKPTPNVTESKFKYGKDDHGSNDITTYKIQIRSSKKTGEVTGNAYDKFRPLVAFSKAMLETLNHECRFIPFDSRNKSPPINRSDEVPAAEDLKAYVGNITLLKNNPSQFRKFDFKMLTSYPRMGSLQQQEAWVNNRHEKPFNNFLRAQCIILEVIQCSAAGPRQRSLIRGATQRANPSEIKEELIARAKAKGKEIDECAFQLMWGNCTTSKSIEDFNTEGLCLYCKIEDDEAVYDSILSLPKSTPWRFPSTYNLDFVDAQYNKDTTANTFQHLQQLKYQDEFLKGVIFLTLKNMPKTVHPFKFIPKNTSEVHLRNEVQTKVKLEKLTIGQILLEQQFAFDTSTIDSPFKAVHCDQMKGEWYLESQGLHAPVIEIIAESVCKFTYSLLGPAAPSETTYSTEGMVSKTMARMAALKKAKMQSAKCSSDDTATHPSTTSNSTNQATPLKTDFPPKTPSAPKPNTVPPTPMVSNDAMDRIIALLHEHKQVVIDIKVECSKQEAQMKQMKKELGEIRATISSASVPQVVNVNEITSQVSELSSITKLVRDELVVIGKAIADNANDQVSKTAEVHEAVERMKLGINKLSKATTSESYDKVLGYQKFHAEQLTALAEQMEELEIVKEDQMARMAEILSVVESLALPSASGRECKVEDTKASREETAEILQGVLEKFGSTSILRCLLQCTSLRELLYEAMDPSDCDSLKSSFSGHNHKRLSAINSLGWDEVTRLLHKSPEHMTHFVNKRTGNCALCEEVTVPGQMEDCGLCNRSFHRICHIPMYFDSKDGVDFRLCRPCRDTVHFERVLESIENCPKCVEWVGQQQHRLHQYSIKMGNNVMTEYSRAIRDAAEGNDMYDAISKDIENCMAFLFSRVLPEDDPEDAYHDAQPPTTSPKSSPAEPIEPSGMTKSPTDSPPDVTHHPPTITIPDTPPNPPVATYSLPPKMMKIFNQQTTDELPPGSRMVSFRVSTDGKPNEPPAVVTVDLNSNLSTLQKEYIRKFVPIAFTSTNYPILVSSTKVAVDPIKEAEIKMGLYTPPDSPNIEDAIDFQTGRDGEGGMSTPLHGFNEIHEKDDDSVETPTLKESEDESTELVSSEEDASIITRERKKGTRTLRPTPKLGVTLRPRKGVSRNGLEDDSTEDGESDFGGSGGGLDIL